MPYKGSPLGIGLSIDFAQLDTELGKVADKIEGVGKDVSLKVGTLAGMAAKGGVDPDKLSHQLSQVGVRLSEGMAGGIRASSALMLGFGSRINSMLDRLAGAAITIFTRIDAAIKGRRWDMLFTRMSISLGHFASGAKGKLSPIDKAIKGAFGKPIQIVATLFNTLFTDLGNTFENTMKKATSDMTKSFESSLKKIRGLVKAIVRGMSKDFKTLLGSTSLGGGGGAANVMGLFGGAKAKPTAGPSPNVSAFPPAQTTQRTGLGRRIGLTTRPLPASMAAAPAAPAAAPAVGATPVKPGMFTGLLDILKKTWKVADDVSGAFLSLGKKAQDAPTAAQERLSNLLNITKNVALGVTGITLAAVSLGVIGPPAILGLATSLGTMALSTAKAAAMFVYAKTTFAALFAAATTIGGKVAAISGLAGGFKRIGEAVLRSTGAVKGLNMAMEALSALGLKAGNVGKLIGGILTVANSVTNGIWRLGAGLLNIGVLGARGIGRMFVFFSTLGGVGTKTYSQLYERHGLFVGSVASSVKTVLGLGSALKNLATGKGFKTVADEAGAAKTSIGQATGAVKKMSSSVLRLGTEIAAAFGIIGIVYKVVGFFTAGTKAATELNATVARSKAVFGNAFGDVDAQAEKLARSSGVAKQSQLELASEFGAMGQSAGMSEAQSASLANELTALSVDFTVLGVSVEEAGDAIKSGLAGKGVSLKQLGAQTDEAATKAYAYSHGIARTGAELTKQQVIAARTGLIFQGLGYAQGSLGKASKQASVQFQVAGGGIALFGEKVGEVLLPVIQAATVGFNALMGTVLDITSSAGPALKDWAMGASDVVMTLIADIKQFGPEIVANMTWAWEESKKGPLGFVTQSIEWLGSFAKAIPEAIGIAVRNAGELWEIAKLQFGAFVTNSIAYIETFPTNFGRIWDWLGRNWYNLIMDMGSMFMKFSQNLSENVVNLASAIWSALKGEPWEFVWTPLLDGFKKTTEELPELIKPALLDVSGEVEKLYENIGQNELKRPKLKAPEEAAALGKKPIPQEAAKGTEYKLGGALEVGSKEAFSAISRANAGKTSTTDAVKQGVTVAKESHAVLQQIAKNTAGGGAAGAFATK